LMKKILLAAFAIKVSVILLMAWGYHRLPFQVQNWNANFHFPPSDPPGPWSFLTTWDAQHYLFLAGQGFRSDHITGAFYPLFPLLVRALDFLLPGDGRFAGILLSTLLTLLAIGHLYLLVARSFGERVAFGTCLLVLCFPTGFFLGLVYTEALFLFLSAAFFLHWGKGETKRALVAAFLLPLCRPTGFLVLVPLLAGVVLSKKVRVGDWAPLTGAIGGFLSYLLFMKVTCGSYWAGFAAQDFFRTGHLSVLSSGPLEWWVRNFITLDYSFSGYRTSFLDRACFLAFFLTLPWAWRALPRPWFFYALALGTASGISLDLVSYTRYLVVIFPFFVLLASWLRERTWFLAAAFLPLQAYLAIRHALNYWVA